MEHTADAGIIARGPSLNDVFAQAAKGMYSLMVDLAGIHATSVRDVHVEAKDLPNLLSSWLVELLFITETEGLVFCRFDVQIDGNTLRGKAFGEPIDPARHASRGMVKGITRHLLEVSSNAEGYQARVLFDM